MANIFRGPLFVNKREIRQPHSLNADTSQDSPKSLTADKQLPVFVVAHFPPHVRGKPLQWLNPDTSAGSPKPLLADKQLPFFDAAPFAAAPRRPEQWLNADTSTPKTLTGDKQAPVFVPPHFGQIQHGKLEWLNSDTSQDTPKALTADSQLPVGKDIQSLQPDYRHTVVDTSQDTPKSLTADAQAPIANLAYTAPDRPRPVVNTSQSAPLATRPTGLTVAITGAAVAGSQGTSVPALEAPLSGQSATGAQGALTDALESALTGQGGSGDVGTLTADHVDGEVETPPPKRQEGAGSPGRKRRRYEVQVDDQIVTVSSAQEAFALLADVRELAKPAANREVSIIARRRPPAEWSVPAPVVEIEAEAFDVIAGLRTELERTQKALNEAYKQALRDAEIAYWMREMQERDDEEVLLLLH